MKNKELVLSADSLVEVQISNENEQDTLMAIETDSLKDDVTAIFLFFIVIISTTISGIAGPTLYNVEFFKYSFSHSAMQSKQNVFKQHIPGITAQNQFFIMQLSFNVNNDNNNNNVNNNGQQQKTDIFIDFSYIILFRNSNGEEVKREPGTFSGAVKLLPSMSSTESLHFFFDRFISYEQIDINIDFSKVDPKLNDAILSATSGNKDHLKYQMMIRFLFGGTSLAIFFLFYSRLKSIPPKKWLLEQKFTVFLQVFATIGANPLFYIYMTYPSILQDILDSLFFKVFVCFVYFYVLILVDNVKLGGNIYENDTKKRKMCFFLPKVIFFSVQLIVEVVHPIMYHGFAALEGEIETLPHGIVFFLQYSRKFLNLFYVVWFLYLTIKTYFAIDSTEKKKIVIYSIVFGTVLFINFFETLLSNFGGLFQNNSGFFALRFSALYTLVLLMVFFHWPYSVAIDQMYDSPENDNEENDIFGASEEKK